MYTYFADRLIPVPVKTSFPLRKPRHICLYRIDETYEIPFLLFFVTKTNLDGDGSSYKYGLPSIQDKLALSINDTIALFFSDTSLTLSENAVQYRGVIETTNDIYILLQHHEHVSIPHEGGQAWAWALASELVNSKRIFQIPVSLETTRFFLRNSDLLQLYNTEGKPYACPDAGYYPTQDLQMSLKYGLERSEGSLGYQIYFQQQYAATGETGSVIRCAIFAMDSPLALAVQYYEKITILSYLEGT